MKKFLLFSLLAIILVLPSIALALPSYDQGIDPYGVESQPGNPASSDKITNINSLSVKIVNIANLIIYLLILAAVVFITWNVVVYFIKPGAEDRTEAGKSIFYGILGLFIILSIWGLVNILLGTFGTNNNVPIDRLPNADFIRR